MGTHDDTVRSPAPEGPLPEVATEQPGRYRVLRELARGGQGVVFVAWDQHLGREVAFKQPLAGEPGGGSATEPGTLEARFIREARLTAQLEHPGIAPVHEVGRRRNGSLYLAQKLVRGRTLAAALEGAPELEARLRLLPAFQGLCEVVAFAHQRGVIHRDLKPGNLMLGQHGELVVLDWGLGRAAGEEPHPSGAAPPPDAAPGTDTGRTRQGWLLGTLAYMSPEQARGAAWEADARCDVWSLGVILFEVLTGETPFSRLPPDEVLRAITRGEVRPVREACPAAPPELAALADRALALDPARRPRDAGEFSAALAAALQGLPPPPRPWAARVALACALLAGVAAGAWYASRPGPPAAPRPARPGIPSNLGAVISGKQPELARCAAAQHRVDEQLQVAMEDRRLRLQWFIEADGSVSDLTVLSEEYRDTPLAACVLAVLKSLKFEPSGSYAGPVPYTFVF